MTQLNCLAGLGFKELMSHLDKELIRDFVCFLTFFLGGCCFLDLMWKVTE
jgi:hypothetical protein